MGKKKGKKEQTEQLKVDKVGRDWRVGDYIRQLSIVILGIVVTFIGSDMASEYSKQKDIRLAMRLVKEELNYNHEQLTQIEEKWARVCEIAAILVDSNFQYQKFSPDTLEAYFTLFNRFHSFSRVTDAMEVFKSSGLMQNISDKRLMLSITKTYDALKDAEEGLSSFYKLKEELVFSVAYRNNVPESLRNGNVMGVYELLLSHVEVRSFVSVVPGFLNPDTFEKAQRQLKETIQELDKEYDL